MAEPVRGTDLLQRDEDQFGVRGNFKAGQLGDELRGLANDSDGRNATLFVEHDLFELGFFFVVDQISAALTNSFTPCLQTSGSSKMRLWSEAQMVPLSKVLEAMTLLMATLQVGGLGDENRGVAGADANGGVAGAVCRLNHGAAAGGQDQRTPG